MGGATTDPTRDDHSREEFPLASGLAVFQSRSDPARPLTANDVMSELGCSRRKQGLVATRKVGARGRVWWIPLDEVAEQTIQVPLERDASVELQIKTADLPGSGETLERRREALRAACDYLSENPNTSTTAFLEEVFPEHPAGYQMADKWWEMIEPALKDLPNVSVSEGRDHP